MTDVQRMNYRKTRMGAERSVTGSTAMLSVRCGGSMDKAGLLMKMLGSGLDLRNICRTWLGLNIRDERKRGFGPE